MDLSKLYTNGQSPPKGSCSSTVNFCGSSEMNITTIPSAFGGDRVSSTKKLILNQFDVFELIQFSFVPSSCRLMALPGFVQR